MTEEEIKKLHKKIDHMRTAIIKLQKVTLGSIFVIILFLYGGFKTIELGEKELGYIVQLIGILAGGGVAGIAATRNDHKDDDDEDE